MTLCLIQQLFQGAFNKNATDFKSSTLKVLLTGLRGLRELARGMLSMCGYAVVNSNHHHV